MEVWTMNDRPVFDQPFELWREDGVLYLVLGVGAQVRIHDIKEFIRLVAALDGTGFSPVLIEYASGASVAEEARMLLRRVCGAQGHPVGILAIDPDGRAQAEVFKVVERPAFPFRVFARRDEALRWVRERRQLATLVMRS